ncbi:mechanosensitive ion channel domain-containing protein [Winogradskyella bathintestinalis]|uniref:Mechanosensitive ion channel n=1 Tax=Winogradskyella bathintestinalis TaxID=3035208 RepID=A0ABT7ZWJ8_9FLAO|nr:mechanosensitive ion channel domain-containing protein [Winogradskyella bathintestinalis]MDN3493349.1 mechanosensitive ion channel [Winogradskyella bathintestinalis]
MPNYFQLYQTEIIYTTILFVILFTTRKIIVLTVKKIGHKSGTTEARATLIGRNVTVVIVLIAILIESIILGVEPQQISLIFSSVFAVIGIGLFAIWSILSNITSGVIMFFSFPYKVGDKIKIHDKDAPIEAIIEDIRAFQLILREDNGNITTYPNNLILQKAVTLMQKDALDDTSIL